MGQANLIPERRHDDGGSIVGGAGVETADQQPERGAVQGERALWAPRQAFIAIVVPPSDMRDPVLRGLPRVRHALEVRRHDADDRVVRPLIGREHPRPRQSQILAEDVGITVKLSRPKRVADHHHARPVVPIVVGAETAPHDRRDAQHAEVVRRHALAAHHHHVGARSQSGEVGPDASQIGKDVVGFEHIAVVAVRQAIDARILQVDVPQFRRRADVRRPEQHRIDQAEDRRVDADPDGQHEDGDDGEAWGLAEGAEGVAEVLEHPNGSPFSVLSAVPGSCSTVPDCDSDGDVPGVTRH